jgi:RNA polymerase sigma-70 factor (ECF subfamily)
MNLEQEKQLVIKAQQSLEAFDALYEYYLPKIYGYVFNRTGNKEITEDIVSQTFITAMLNLKKYKDKGVGFGAWLYRIAHNTFVDYFRKNKGKAQMLDENSAELMQKEINEYEQIENNIVVRKALLKIPEQYQQILSLKYFEEFDNQEISEIIGCKKETLAVKLHRSLEALKKVLEFENKTYGTN